MDVLRTPDECFADLSGWSYAPRYVEVAAGDGTRLRMAAYDEGPREAPVVLCLHGEPSWSYLYRHVMAVLLDAGLRAVAIDLVGFGRSDKPSRREDYTYQRHVDWVRAAIDALGIADVTLLAHDWGGLIGLRLVGQEPQLFAAVVAANTFLPTGDRDLGEAFRAWQQYAQQTPRFQAGGIVNGACVSALPPEVIAAYDAPFPSQEFLAGARQFPLLVPTTPDDPAAEPNRRAWVGLKRYSRPFLCAFSDQDPVTRGADRVLVASVPGAGGQPHVTLTGGGHFLQEDVGAQLGAVVVEHVARAMA